MQSVANIRGCCKRKPCSTSVDSQIHNVIKVIAKHAMSDHLKPLYYSLLFSLCVAAISWYDGTEMQEVIVQGIRQGISAKDPLERKHR